MPEQGMSDDDVQNLAQWIGDKVAEWTTGDNKPSFERYLAEQLYNDFHIVTLQERANELLTQYSYQQDLKATVRAEIALENGTYDENTDYGHS